MKQKKNRIFIGLSETSGFYGRLYEGLIQLGVECFFAPIALNKHEYSYELKTNKLVQVCQISIMKAVSSSNIVFKVVWRMAYECFKFLLFFWAIFKYNVFIFSGGKCFWGVKDIWIYKLFKKKLVFICLGSFTRLPFTDGSFLTGVYTGKRPSVKDMVSETIKRQKRVDILEKYADVFINLPSQAQLNRRKYISLCNIGLPLGKMPEALHSEKMKHSENIVRILHAPSYIGCRGTLEFRKILEELKGEGFLFEYFEVTGVKNEVLLQRIQECDFIIDELYSDTPMATLVQEAAFYGKPAVVGGYFAEHYIDFYERELLPPSLYVTPENIKQAIRKMITEKEFREELGKKAQNFVKKNCTSEIVAKKINSVIMGVSPQKWIMEAESVENIYGYGMSQEKIKEVVSSIVKIGGDKKLSSAGNIRALEVIDRFCNNGGINV